MSSVLVSLSAGLVSPCFLPSFSEQVVSSLGSLLLIDMAAAVCALRSDDNSLFRWLTAVGGLLAAHVPEDCLLRTTAWNPFEETGEWPQRVAQQVSEPHDIQYLVKQSKWQRRLPSSCLEEVQMLTWTGLGRAS